ncbi:related to RTA1 domain protein [Ramularia collo-cygni]|uniref:Related to RTA1 domain protein n=1 Tax=Ramularia collo-cygni TaxID=112498 RepID=A0A2D3V0N0_9PEZI|nr:related to RTA1 domain protein [Ramularia collo-cygni]CZT16024.1 related to RTA1 domain protein [Ramularia collo-cygni]
MNASQITAHPGDYCTVGTCSLLLAHLTYIPSLLGNLTYLTIFAIILLVQLYLGIRHKTWGYLVGMVGGLALEIIGYAGRIQMHFNPFPFDPFLEYLICLTIGPAFIAAAIYLCLGHIVVVYGEDVSSIKPRTYSLLFVTCDFLSLVLQAVGGALAATADTRPDRAIGVNVMIAGLSTQVVSLILFMGLCAELAWRVRRSPHLNERTAGLRSSRRWKLFLFGLAIATITIFIRCVFRVAELQSGFKGELFNHEVTFMFLEGPMIIIASVFLTIFHPGVVCFGYEEEIHWSLRRQKQMESTHHKLGSLEHAGGADGRLGP